MNIKDFKVGQTVYVELTGNASRGKTPEQRIEEWEVTSVGRKYIKARKKENGIFRFETTFEYRERYEKFIQKTDHGANYILYLTRHEIEEKHEKNRLIDEVVTFFRDWNKPEKLSIEQLKMIKEILEEGTESQ